MWSHHFDICIHLGVLTHPPSGRFLCLCNPALLSHPPHIPLGNS